jgi:hypothetical protein
MGSISGSQTNIGVKIASTWGTAVAAGSGNKFGGELTPNFDPASILQARAVGSGWYMLPDETKGAVIPTVSLVGDLGYRNNWDVILAQMMGTAAAPTETTTGQADYKHVVKFNTTLNTKYVTIAWESSSTTTIEIPTAACRKFGIKTTSIPGYLEASAELLGGQVNLSSSTNTNTTLQATTFTEGTPELVACDYSDYYRHNVASGSALNTGDTYAITSFDFNLERPQEIIPEIKGGTAWGVPTASGFVNGTLAVTVKELADHAMFTIWNAETAYKAIINVQGTQIGTGTNKTWAIYIPRMKLISAPVYAVTDPGTNTLSLKWDLLYTSTAPTGMTGYNYPAFEITNTLSTSLLA